MDSKTKKVKGLGLCSGGLDSILAGCVLRDQGVDVEWITFETPFFSAEKAKKASENYGIPLIIMNITPEYLIMLKNPPMGYGQNMNPCMDCHALMFRLAGNIMRERGFDFLFSGEVLGQRPMSQTQSSLRYVEKRSGYDGYILRPLSARLLPESIPEKQGQVNRELLLDISGRSRKPQMALAQKFGVRDYPSPAGGCLLTDQNFSRRLKDMFDHQETYTENELHLLKYGRHFRLQNGDKVIVGRTKEDNENISAHQGEGDTVVALKDHAGPLVLLPNGGKNESILLAASLCIGYSKAPQDTPVAVTVSGPDGDRTIQALGVPPKAMEKLMV